ncbi:TetR/AcrR family transcriptional regulator [Pelobium manganitolerans]|uniref:TetR/AcrR family transcriptional regulator n=1 Tax=Pelobium manganitolerans TaxID=1842495 RepID=UPI003FA34430
MELKETDIQDRILEKARELFFFFGVKSITMDDIAKHLSISKKTLYSCYKDKAEIVNLIMGDLLQAHVAEILKTKETAANAVEEVLTQSRVLYQIFKEVKPNVFFEIEKYFPEIAGQFADHRGTCVLESISQNLERGIAEGLYRNNLDIPFVARLRLNALMSAFDEKAFEMEMPTLHILNKLTSFYLHAICSAEGKKLIAEQ